MYLPDNGQGGLSGDVSMAETQQLQVSTPVVLGLGSNADMRMHPPRRLLLRGITLAAHRRSVRSTAKSTAALVAFVVAFGSER
jgi:hypothetical protein